MGREKGEVVCVCDALFFDERRFGKKLANGERLVEGGEKVEGGEVDMEDFPSKNAWRGDSWPSCALDLLPRRLSGENEGSFCDLSDMLLISSFAGMWKAWRLGVSGWPTSSMSSPPLSPHMLTKFGLVLVSSEVRGSEVNEAELAVLPL